MLEVGNSRQITDIKDFLGTCRRSDVTGFTLKMVENTHEFHIQSAGDPSFLVVANDKEKADQLLQSLPPEVPRHGGFAMEEEHGDGATAAAAHEPSPEEIAKLKAEAAERKKNAPPKEKKQQEKKKKEKKEQAPAAEQPVKEMTAKDHLAALDKAKKSEFSMDAWKKLYSNCGGDYKTTMAEFWKLFDAEGWSIWTCRYKYNSENEKAFMASNVINGFIQRSGEIRKWLFGVMWVVGEEGKTPLEISGCYFMRGHDIGVLKQANDDAEHYNWCKVDTATESGKNLVYEMWCSMDGKFEYLEGKFCVACSEFK